MGFLFHPFHTRFYTAVRTKVNPSITGVGIINHEIVIGRVKLDTCRWGSQDFDTVSLGLKLLVDMSINYAANMAVGVQDGKQFITVFKAVLLQPGSFYWQAVVMDADQRIGPVPLTISQLDIQVCQLFWSSKP